MKIAKNGLYLRIEKSTNVNIPEGLSYKEAIEYGYTKDLEGSLEYDLYIDVMYEDGEVANEAGYEELK